MEAVAGSNLLVLLELLFIKHTAPAPNKPVLCKEAAGLAAVR